MIEIPHLEWHITHNCNLSCQGCAHFTNHGHDWFADIETLKTWYSYWNKRISPHTIAILGGEPLLHKNVIDIIYLTREMWNQPPESNIKSYYQTPRYEIVTNGILIDREKHKDLPKCLVDTDCTLSLSIHSNKDVSLEYTNKLKKSLNIIKDWKKQYNIKVHIYDSFNDWVKIYKNFGINSEPFEDNNPEKSWENCPTGKECFQLYDGNIYKCSLTAYLGLQKNKYGQLLSEKWDPYLKYVPLTPNCSDEDIIQFFNKGAESVCGMCPQNPQSFKKNDPLIPVSQYENNQQNKR
jgi:sulfatase maturation enzyme AslB (radical SAM superfamily)